MIAQGRRWTIQVKLALLVLLGLVGMAVAISVLLFSTANTLFAQQAQTELSRQNEVVAAAINNLTAKAASDLLLSRQNPVFDDYFLARDDASIQAAVRGIEKQILYLSSIFSIDEICVIDRAGPERARCVQGMLAGLDQLSPDETGNVFFRPTLALEDGQVYRSPTPYLSPDTHRWVVAHATPLVLPDGTKAGILHFEIPLVWFADRVETTDLAGSFSFLMTRDGKMLIHPQLAAMQRAAGIDLTQPDQAAFPPVTAGTSPSFQALAAQMAAGQAGLGQYHDDQDTYKVVYQPAFAGQWVIATVLPNTVIYQPGRSLVARTLTVVIPLLIVGLAMMLWYTARLVRPLQTTARALRLAGGGGVSQPLPVNSRDEIGDVALAFNQMTEALRASQQSVAERTLALEQSNQELAQAYRLVQENHGKLLTAEKMASLGRLTAGIAHEMNTPLATVRVTLSNMGKLVHEYLSSIGDSEVTPDDHRAIAVEMREAVRLGDKAAERAASFVRGIRSQTREQVQDQQRQVDAVPIIREALLLLSHRLREKHCTVVFEPASEQVHLLAAPGRLAQVVTNLVANSVDAMSAQGGGTITISLTSKPPNVELQVCDGGSGIAPENLSRIFEPMFTTKPFGEGTGLGLSIVHDIVVGEFRGKIDVVSELGQGATFTLTLPGAAEGQYAA
ncbi:MAG: sensor histidine kinase [Anaerolineales bacterium]